MPRTFNGSTEYIGFAPKTWDTWQAPAVYSLCRRQAGGVNHTIYFAGTAAAGAVGNLQLWVSTLNDLNLGCNAASTAFAGTVGGGATITLDIGAAKASGTATPRADYNQQPFIASWIHSNMAATLANPATTASAIEEVGRADGDQDYWNGDFEWVGIWNLSAQLTGNQSESFIKIGARFLAGLMHGCQRFWWFNQYPTDTVGDLSNHGADQIARTGTTHTATNQQYWPGLAGTTFDVVPGVL